MNNLRRKGMSALAVMVSGAFVLSACGGDNGDGDDNGGGEGEPEDIAEDADVSEFNVAWHAQPPTLDPVMTTATAAHSMARNVYEPLLILDADNELQPVLAESWEEDGANIVFTLREGVEFHNGEPMTAEDVAVSMNRWMELSNLGQLFFADSEMEVTGELEVTLVNDEPMYPALILMGAVTSPPVVMPASLIEDAPPEGLSDMIGTGPYRFVEWETDQHIHFELNEDYSPAPGEPNGLAGDRTGTYENLYYRMVPDASTRVSGIQSGEYDVAMNLPYDNFDQVDSDPNLDTFLYDGGFGGAVFNKAEGPLADENLRQAVNAALDMEAILTAAYTDDRFYTMNGALADEESLWHSEAGLDNYNVYDPELAEQLIAESDYDGETIRIVTTRDYEEYYNSAVIMEQQLGDVGFNVELNVVDWATVTELRDDPTAHDISMTAWSPIEMPIEYTFFNPSWSGWTDSDEIDAAIEKATYAPDEDTAYEGIEELQEAFYEYLPVLNFGYRSNVVAVREGLAGYEPPRGAGDMFYRVYPTE